MDYIARAQLITVPVVMAEWESRALLQFLNKIDWGQIRSCADSDEQAFHMRSGLIAVRVGLEQCGFSPG